MDLALRNRLLFPPDRLLIRLQKYLAESGLASRRASEQLIAAGRVAVNGRLVRELGTKVDSSRDRITVDGTRVQPRRKLYVALHKPAGFICTRKDPEARRTVAELLPAEWKSLYTVGRLDCDSEGLIFLTNDGDFCLRLTHPRYGISKIYLVTVEGRVDAAKVESLRRGVLHEGERLKPDQLRVVSANNTQSLVEVALREGKNREVRRMFAAENLIIQRLLRTQIGSIKLGELPSGKWRVLSAVEVKALINA